MNKAFEQTSMLEAYEKFTFSNKYIKIILYLDVASLHLI